MATLFRTLCRAVFVGTLALTMVVAGNDVARAADPSGWVVHDLGLPAEPGHPYTWSEGTAISGTKVIGLASDGRIYHAFVYDHARPDRGVTNLGTLGGDSSLATDISGDWIVGLAETDVVGSGGLYDLTAFAYNLADPNPRMWNFAPSANPRKYSWASAVSGTRVVGARDDRAFVFDLATAAMKDLHDVVGGGSGETSLAEDISGDMVVGATRGTSVKPFLHDLATGRTINFEWNALDLRMRVSGDWVVGSSRDKQVVNVYQISTGTRTELTGVFGGTVVVQGLSESKLLLWSQRDGAFAYDLSSRTRSDFPSPWGDNRATVTDVTGGVAVGTISGGEGTRAAVWDHGPSVTPVEVRFDDRCGSAMDTYTIPKQTGMSYLVGGVVREPGVQAASGTVTVTSKAAPGYQLRGTTSWKHTFTGASTLLDVPAGSQFFDEICWMVNNDIATGWVIPDRGVEYAPLTSVSRDAMAAFMYRLAGSPEFTEPAISPFKDVSPETQFYKEISWLASKGISTGWPAAGGAEFRPLEPVSRDAMAAFMYRLAGSPAFTPPKVSPFKDVTPSTQFYKEISWLASKGISTGWPMAGGAEFRPLEWVNRDAMAAFMYRLKVVNKLI